LNIGLIVGNEFWLIWKKSKSDFVKIAGIVAQLDKEVFGPWTLNFGHIGQYIFLIFGHYLDSLKKVNKKN